MNGDAVTGDAGRFPPTIGALLRESVTRNPDRIAGIAPQAMPPSVPTISISGSSNGESHWLKVNATQEPRMAPTVNWPSAPIFQVLER